MLSLRSPLMGRLIPAGAAVAVVTASLVLSRDAGLDEDDLQAYEEQFISLSRQVGTVIELGTGEARSMKQAVGDVERGELDGDALRSEAEVWRGAILEVRDRALAVDAPAALTRAHELFLVSLDFYLEVAAALESASTALNGPERSERLDQAVALGSCGDTRYDRAAAAIQAERRALGLQPNLDLPDPEGLTLSGVEVVGSPKCPDDLARTTP